MFGPRRVSRALLCVYCIKVPIKASPLSPEHQNTCTSGVIRVIAVTRGVINRGQPHDPGTWVASHTEVSAANNIYENKDAGQGSEEGNGQIDIITLYNVYIKYFFVDMCRYGCRCTEWLTQTKLFAAKVGTGLSSHTKDV